VPGSPRIEVQKQHGDAFRVTVSEGSGRTTHTVTVEDGYYEKLTDRKVPVEELVRRSFEFLLERESKESILGTFALPVIGRYFPEYERDIRRRLQVDAAGS
jgi:hypothetical protein